MLPPLKAQAWLAHSKEIYNYPTVGGTKAGKQLLKKMASVSDFFNQFWYTNDIMILIRRF
jgi:hypothetical protein